MHTEPAAILALLWLLFGGTHVGLATGRVRGALVDRLGDRGFMALFSAIASISFAALVVYYAAHRYEGAPGLALTAVPAVRWLLMAAIAFGVALITAGLIAYPRMPMALFDQPIRQPRGIERITRHPFFVGVAVLGVAHAFLATRLVGAVFAAGLAVLGIAGAWHQDRKLLARRGGPYADYLARTSTVPFAAALAGQPLAWRELPLGALAGGLVLAVVLRLGHGVLFAHGGAWIIVAVSGGGAIASWQTWRRTQRRAALLTASEVR
jgi:uncharacterized membrane protein